MKTHLVVHWYDPGHDASMHIPRSVAARGYEAMFLMVGVVWYKYYLAT